MLSHASAKRYVYIDETKVFVDGTRDRLNSEETGGSWAWLWADESEDGQFVSIVEIEVV